MLINLHRLSRKAAEIMLTMHLCVYVVYMCVTACSLVFTIKQMVTELSLTVFSLKHL